MNHPTLPFVPRPLSPALLSLIRAQARQVRRSICPMTAYPASQGTVRRACADEAERAAALEELKREVMR